MSELKKVNVELPRDLKLLEKFYETLMKPNFPLENELEPLEVWIEKLSEDQTKAAHELHVVLALDPKDDKIVGGICYEYYAKSNCILITYLVIDSSVRNQGTSMFLALSAWKGMEAASTRRGYAQPNAIFCEVNDPEKIKDSQDSVSPIARLRAFQQMGVRTLEKFNYVQPALHGRADKGRDMLLGIVVGPMLPREKGKLYIESKHVKQFITDFYQELSVPDYKNDVDYKMMLKDLEGRDKVFITDFDLSRFQKAKKTQIAKKPTESLVPVHIVVVGAGLSGLACARELTKKGFSVTILEGRHRLGGRIYTGRSFDARLEVGAAWLHGTEGSTLAAFMNKHVPQLQYYKSDEQSLALIDEDGKQIPSNVIFECYLKFLNLLEAVAAKYGSQDDRLEKEIEAENKALQRAKQQSDVADIDPVAYEHVLINQAKRTTKHVIEGLNQVAKKRCSVPLQQAVEEIYQANKQFHYQNKQEKEVYNYLFSNLESLQNATMKELNACDYDYGMLLEGGDQMVLGGFNNVITALSSGLKIHTDSEVVKIDYSNANKQNKQAPRVKVHTKDGHVYDCDGVLVTCPIGVLKNSLDQKDPSKPKKPQFQGPHFSCEDVASYPAVQFEPRLPAWKQTAIQNIGVGHFNKVILRFPFKFWLDFDYVGFNLPRDAKKEDTQNLAQATKKRENMWLINAHAPTQGEPILVCLISGDFAREAERLSDQEITHIVMDKLRFIYEKNPENIVLSPSAPSSKFSSQPPASISKIPDPIDVIVTRWVSDPYSQCSYSFLPIGCTIQDFDAMAASVEDVVFFAGEHTSRHRFGYADGAFGSGLREAKRIIDLYQNLVPKQQEIRSKL